MNREKRKISLRNNWKNPKKFGVWNSINWSSKSEDFEECFLLSWSWLFLTGLVKKPWVAEIENPNQTLGHLHVTLKTSEMGSGVILTCTLDKAEELRLPRGSRIIFELYIVKDFFELSYDSTLVKKVGQKITPIEEQFDFPIETEDIHEVQRMGTWFSFSSDLFFTNSTSTWF